MDLEGKEIKEFSEFDEITPNSTHNIITDAGRCSVGALFTAVVAYAQPYLDECRNSFFVLRSTERNHTNEHIRPKPHHHQNRHPRYGDVLGLRGRAAFAAD